MSDHDELEPLRSIVDGLRAHEDFGDVDLVPQIRAAIAAPPAPKRRRALYAGGALVAALAACAALWIGLPRRDRDEGFQAKGAAAGDADRWVGLTVYQAGPDGAFHRADRVSAARPLAFAYTNVGPNPFGYLVVLGLDSTGEYFRYYPAEDEPRSIAIRADSGVQLPDLVEHELHPGLLLIYAVFSDRALTVPEVEAALAARRPIADAALVTVAVQVVP